MISIFFNKIFKSFFIFFIFFIFLLLYVYDELNLNSIKLIIKNII